MSVVIDLTQDAKPNQQIIQTRLSFINQFLSFANAIKREGIWTNRQILIVKNTQRHKQIRILFPSQNLYHYQIHHITISEIDFNSTLFQFTSLFKAPHMMNIPSYYDFCERQITKIANKFNKSQHFQIQNLKTQYFKGDFYSNSHYSIYNVQQIKKIIFSIFRKIQQLYYIKKAIEFQIYKMIQINRNYDEYRDSCQMLKKIKNSSKNLKLLSNLAMAPQQEINKEVPGPQLASNLIKSQKQIKSKIQNLAKVQRYNPNSELLCRQIKIKQQFQPPIIQRNYTNSIIYVVTIQCCIFDTVINSRNNSYNQKNLNQYAAKAKPKTKTITKDFVKKVASLSKDNNGVLGLQNQMVTLTQISSSKSPFIAKYYLNSSESSNEKKSIYLEYYALSLSQYLKKYKRELKIIDILLILEQIFEGVHELNQLNIIHGDLKMQNCMIDVNTVKIIDLGSSSEPIYPKNHLIQSRNQLFCRRIFSTHYRKFNEIDRKLKLKYESQVNYYKNLKFDMFAIGHIAQELLEDYIMSANLSMHIGSELIQHKFRELIASLQKDDVNQRLSCNQGKYIIYQLKTLVGFQQSQE